MLGLILTLFFVFYKGRSDNRHKILAFFFLSVTIGSFSISWHVLQTAPAIAILSSHFSASILLAAPLAYLYIDRSFQERPWSARKDNWHFLPAMFVFFGHLPYSVSSWEYKRSIIEKIQTNQVNYKEHLMNAWVTPQQFQLIFTAQIIIYLTLIWKKWIPSTQQPPVEITSFRRIWLKWFTGVFTVNCLLSISMAFLKFNNIQTSLSVELVKHVMEIGSIFYIFLNAVVLFAPILTNSDIIKSLSENKGESAIKRFSPEYIQTIEEKLNLYVEAKKFLEADSKIAGLVEFTSIPLHHLSAYFNQHLYQSFPDWRNNLRIIEAKQLIAEGLCDELNMEGIAQRVGFTNRSTFSIVFRKHAGISPTDFWRLQNTDNQSKLTA
jgi:AraC-like DNA-binding protein